MRYEQFGKFRFVMERTHHGGLIEPHYFGLCNRGHRRQATPMAVQAALTKEVPLLMERDHGFLALLGNHGDLARAVDDVKDSICQISLAAYYFILLIFRFGPSPVCLGEERLKNEGLLSLGFSGQGSALDTRRVRV